MVASRFSPCRRGLAHLKRVHSVASCGSCLSVVPSSSGARERDGRHLVPPTHNHVRRAATVGWEATDGTRTIARAVLVAVNVQ